MGSVPNPRHRPPWAAKLPSRLPPPPPEVADVPAAGVAVARAAREAWQAGCGTRQSAAGVGSGLAAGATPRGPWLQSASPFRQLHLLATWASIVAALALVGVLLLLAPHARAQAQPKETRGTA